MIIFHLNGVSIAANLIKQVRIVRAGKFVGNAADHITRETARNELINTNALIAAIAINAIQQKSMIITLPWQ